MQAEKGIKKILKMWILWPGGVAQTVRCGPGGSKKELRIENRESSFKDVGILLF